MKMFHMVLASLAVVLMTATHSMAEAPLQPQDAPPPISKSAVTLSGTVIPYVRYLKEQGIQFDNDTPESTLSLVGNDGKLYLIVKNEGSRALFKDQELHSRPVQLVAVQVPGTQLIQIERIRTIVDGKTLEVDYWCEKCALRYSEPGICICCGAQAERRELPIKNSESPSESKDSTR